jgi:3-methyladenine DNA glycosylase Tag
MYVLDKQRSHGSFAKFIAEWPEDDLVGLWLELKKQGSRLGGNSGPMMLRSMGKDTFLLTKDVSDALINQGLMKKFSPTAQRDLRLVEQVFTDLREQSGRSLCEISRILAFTV